MSILVLPTSPIIETQLAALRRLAPAEAIETDPDRADPARVEAIFAFRLPPGLAARFPNLRFVAGAGAGVDELGAEALPHGVALTRSSDPAQAVRMAQYVALAILRWHRELARYESQQRSRTWTRGAPEHESAWACGLMGLGTLGSAVAAALRALGYPVRAWTRTPRQQEGISTFSGPQGLAPFLAGTRVLVCLLPLTPLTRGLVAAPLLEQLPPHAYVINVARGALLDEGDLLAALASGRLAGAALDVHAREPLPGDSPLWADGRILVTPHVAAIPDPANAARLLLDNLDRARRGEPLLHVVDPDRGY